MAWTKIMIDMKNSSSSQRNGRRLNYLLAMACIFIVAWVAAGGYIIWQKVNNKVHALEEKVQTDVAARLSALATQESSLEGTVQTLRETVENRNEDWTAAKAEYLMWIANERLLLQHDIPTAVSALTSADRRLAATGDPSLLPVRQKLAGEIAALRAVPDPDIAGLALSLAGLTDQVERLPLTGSGITAKNASPAQSRQAHSMREFLDTLWAHLRSLIIVTRKSAGDPPLLAPEQRYFLRENLILELEAARLALLRRDTQNFRRSLRTAREWIDRYFRSDAPITNNTLETLASMEKIELQPPLPDISDSLKTLQQWAKKQGRDIDKKLDDDLLPPKGKTGNP